MMIMLDSNFPSSFLHEDLRLIIIFKLARLVRVFAFLLLVGIDLDGGRVGWLGVFCLLFLAT